LSLLQYREYTDATASQEKCNGAVVLSKDGFLYPLKGRSKMGVYRRGKDWWIDYYFQGRRRREKVGSSKTLAETVLKKRKVEIAENKFLDIQRDSKIKFEEMAKTYLEAYSKPNKRSSRRDEGIVKNLLPFFGGRYLYEITPLDVENYKRKRKEQVATATVNRELACLKHIFNKAIEWDKARENPVIKVKFFGVKNKRTRYLEKEEIKRLLSVCSEPLKSIVTVALNTGMRKGEILNLKWRDIDFNQKIVYLLETKSGEKREVPINEIVCNALLEMRKHPNSPYVFCKEDGKPYHKVQYSFEKALKKAEIKDFRFHDLRHTFASHLVMMGIDLKTVQELLGHKTFNMTLRYAHLSSDHKKQAVDHFSAQMDTIWSPKEDEEIMSKVSYSNNVGKIKVLEDIATLTQW